MYQYRLLSRLMAVLVVTGTLLLSLAGGSLAATQERRLAWSMEALIVIPTQEVVLRGAARAKADLVDPLVARMNTAGIAAQVNPRGTEAAPSYELKAASSGTVEDFRRILHTVLKPEAHLMGNSMEMNISTKGTYNSTADIVVAANPSTGYAWTVVGGNGFIEHAPSDFIMHSRGVGVSQHQVLHLRNDRNSASPIKLVYGRPWESSTATVRLTLDLDSLPPRLDLSDPTVPTVPVAPPVKGAETAVAYPTALATTLPESWDWRTSGIVTPVRDQKSCGSCWAFGTVGVMEAVLWKNGMANVDLSEQFLISCNTANWGCSGGLTAHDFHYNKLGKSQTALGAVLESAKPYTATNGTCTQALAHPYQLSGWQFITPTEFTMPTVDQIKSAIYTYGPITAGVCAGSAWTSYKSGVFSTDETSQCGGSTNHQIVLVGWNDNDGDGYWILRNSWGSSWGIGGYMYIAYNTSRVGEGTSWVTTAASTSVPTITSISPATMNQGSTAQTLTITGTNLTGSSLAISGTGVTFGTATVSATKITVPVTVAITATTGARTIAVTSSKGSASATFTITAPNGVTTLFSDGFESTGWGNKAVTGTVGKWTLATSLTSPVAKAHGGTKVASFNSVTATSGNQARIYRTASFTVPATATTATLNFWMYHDSSAATANDQIQPQVSTNNSTWTAVGSAISRYRATGGWEQISVDLSAYKGKAIFLGFLGTSAKGNNMYLDDVSVVSQ